MSQTTSKPRRRGRPKADETSGNALREAVIDATSQVYAEHGYHKTTVALILKAANISRPTFYKLFKDRYEVIDLIIARANDQLRNQVAQAIIGKTTAFEMLSAGVNTYFDWCEKIGPLAGPIYSEINDPASPASDHRSRIINSFVDLFHAQARILGEPELDPLLYDSLLRAVEHAGSSAFWPKRLPATEIERRRAVALRIMLASLADEGTHHQVPSLDSVLA